MNQAEIKQVAETILAQLGGAKFRAMTGAGSFSSGEFDGNPGLSFRIPRAKQGIRAVIITLTPLDLYTVKFCKMVKFDFTIVSTHEDIYCDQLAEVFEHATGLYTSL